MDPAPLKDTPAVYWFAALGVVVFSVTLGLATGLFRRRTRMKTVPVDGARLRIRPDRSRREHVRAAALLCVSAGIPLLALASRLASHHELDGGGKTFVALAVLIAGFGLVWLARSLVALQAGDDAIVTVARVPLRRDDDIDFRIEIPRAAGTTRAISASVVCIEHAVIHMGRFTHMAHRVVNEMPLLLDAGSTPAGGATGQLTVRFPAASWPASGPGRSLNYTYEWVLRVELPGSGTALTRFPLEVE